MTNKKKQLMESIGEIAGKTLLSMIPGPAGALFQAIWDKAKENAFQDRCEAWVETMEDRLRKIEITLDDVGSSQLFATAMIHATEIAAKTSSDEKRALLANAVANSITTDISEERMVLFFQLIEKYTVAHIRILHYFRDPSFGKGVYYGPMSRPASVLAELSIYAQRFSYDQSYCKKIIRDLQNDSVLEVFQDAIMTESGALAKRTTKFGDDFLAFLEEKGS